MDSMLSAVGPDTTDDQLLAMADALEDHDLPRATLIRLQVRTAQGSVSPSERKQVSALLEADADALLGPLAPFVVRDQLVYAKGFLDECVVKDVHPKHAASLASAFTSPLVRRIRRLKAPLPILVGKELVSLQHARLMGSSDGLGLLGSRDPLPWVSFDAYVFGRAQLDLLDQPQALPRLETLCLHGALGCTTREVHERALSRQVTTFAFEEQHADRAREFFEAGESIPRRTRRLAFFYEPIFMVGKPADFMVELAWVRDTEEAPWARLEISVRLRSIVSHRRQPAIQWLQKAIASIKDLKAAPVVLQVDGKRTDEIRALLANTLDAAFGTAMTT